MEKHIQRPKSIFYLRCLLNTPNAREVRTDRYTFVVERKEDESLDYILFDNQKDPYQLKNIAAESPQGVELLLKDLRKWLQKTNDPWKGAL